MQLDAISCQISNIFKKKGAKPRKPADQFQPDYVKEAKKEARGHKKEANKDTQRDLAGFFEKRNNKVKSIEEKISGK